MTHLAVQSRQRGFGACATMTALFAPMDLLMRRLDPLFGVPIVPRVLNGLSSGEHGKGLDAQINPYFLLGGMEYAGGVQLVLGGKDGEPLIPLPFDGAGLDLAPDLSVQLDLEVSNFGEMQALPD